MTYSLLWKLVGISALVVGGAIATVWIAIDYLAADYFMVLMKNYGIDPTDSPRMFVESIHTYLIWASLAAVGLGLVLSYVLIRWVLTSLFQKAESAEQIVAGNYTVAAPVLTTDEIGQLAETFNTMATSLQSIEQRRKTLVINVAHDLCTPLTNIRGYLEALSDGVVPPSKETFDLLQEVTMRLVHLVEEVLQLARAMLRGPLCKPSRATSMP